MSSFSGFRWFLIVMIAAGLFTSCQWRDDARARTAPPPIDTTSIQVEEPPADSIEAMTDGGAILMPKARQRVLIREDSLWEKALRIHYNAIVIDGHIDTPSLMVDNGYQFGERHKSAESHVDLPRCFEGGLDAAFLSIYVAPGYGEGPGAMERAWKLIAESKKQLEANADSAGLATSADEIRALTKSGKKAMLLGLEGGHALGASTQNLKALYDAGVRYVTLTHINSHSWADASQGAARWNGLNDKGRELVREMNRIGMMVDLSHTSDDTFYDALEVSSAPVILSHSSARALVNSVRNVDDAMLRALAKNGGIVMINFFDPMVNPNLTEEVMQEVRARAPGPNLYNLWDVVYGVKNERGLPGAQLEDVVDHIDHAIKVAGIDHVGLGSDFDGVFDLPAGLQDVTRLPWITYGLLKRGYSEEDLYKVLGGNLLRVMEEVERIAAGATGTAATSN